MLLVLEVGVADLAATRFATSPLSKTTGTDQGPPRVTPSAVPQHLTVLHRGGLVDKRRRASAS